MTPPDEREKAILATAQKLPPKFQAANLDTACAEDIALRQRIGEAVHAPLATEPAAPEPPAANGPKGTILIAIPDEVPGEKPGHLIGRYKLLEKVGEGGMGSVWVADQQEPVRRKVALKIIKLGMDTRQVIARFEAERQALALMDHPNIAKVLDAGATETGRPFFVMELVSGIRITDYCDRHNLATCDRVELFIQVCKAIQHAHQKGILHRDIKPPNILITLHDGLPAPMVIDFGIAKAIGGQQLTDKTLHTALEEFIGTPAYMSPEQAEMNPLGIDTRSDIYSLGVLLYELLTGLTPFEGERFRKLGLAEIRRIIREEDPPRPSTRLTSLAVHERETVARLRGCEPPKLIHLVRGDLDWIVMKCLEKDRTRRYATANEVAQDLQRYLNNEPIIARPPSSLNRFRKLIRRHKLSFAAGFATLLLTPLAALLLVATWPSHPPNVEQLLKRADARLVHYDREGYIERALSDLKTARRADPKDHRVWAKLGLAHWLTYEDNEQDVVRQDAFLCSSNALWWNPDNAEAHLVQGLVARDQRDWVTATNHLLTAKALGKSTNGIALVSLAFACKAAGDAANANLFARLAQEKAANQWDVFNRLGVFHEGADSCQPDLDQAHTNFARAAELAPKSPLAHRHLGQILLRLRHNAEARGQLEKSLELRKTPQTLSSLGSAHLAEKNYEKAQQLFLEAHRADPSRYLYPFNAGLACWQSQKPKEESNQLFADALVKIDDTLKVGGKKTLVRAYRGACLAVLGRAAEARADLETAVQEAADDCQILSIIWTGYHLLGDGLRADEINQRLLRRKK